MSTYPVYLFERRHEDEVGNPNLVLAGRLFYNAFGKRLKRRGRLEVEEIIRGLQADARAGCLPDVVVGWPGVGLKPANAVDTDDEALMRPWRTRAFVVAVRIVSGDDERMTSDGGKPILRTPERTHP